MSKPTTDSTEQTGKVLDVVLPHFVSNAIKVFGRHTIEEQAMPIDVDGLKPSHRRLMLSMRDLGIMPKSNYRKAATIVGHCVGNYHPQGDTGTYGALVSLVWMRYPLVDPHGNWGSKFTLDGAAAAYRYTECRLTSMGKETIDDLAVVPTIPNFDETRAEALFLPARVPLLLCNGTRGIAVAVNGAIPPNNLREVVDACILLIKKPNVKVSKVTKLLLGPDYREGGVILSERPEIAKMYRTGKGTIKFGCEYEYTTDPKKGCQVLVLKSLAPNFNPSTFLERCGQLQDEKLIEYVEDETDESNGFRIVVGFTNPQALTRYVLPMLQTRVNYNFHAIRRRWETVTNGEDPGKEFRHYNVVTLLQEWIGQRKEVEKLLLLAEEKRIRSEIEKSEGRLFATRNIDKVIAIFKDKNNDRPEIIAKLMKLGLTNVQAEYLTELKLIQIRRFSETEQTDNIKRLNKELSVILADLENLNEVLIRRLLEMKSTYGDERITKLESVQAKLKTKAKPRFVVVSVDATYKSMQETPTKKTYFPNRKTASPSEVWITKASETCTVVFRDGKALQFPVYRQDGSLEFEHNHDEALNRVAGVASNLDAKLLTIDADGFALTIENPQKPTSYQTLNSAQPIAFASGINDEDRFFVINKSGNSYWNTGASLTVRRRGAKGKRFERLQAISDAFVVKPGQSIWDQNGNKVDPFRNKAGTIFKFKKLKKDKFFVLSEQSNLIMTISGDLAVLDRKAALPGIRSGKTLKVWPLESQSK